MHPSVFNVFEEICARHVISGSVLEIGATPDESTLLNLPALAGVSEKTGINRIAGTRFRDFNILEGNANDMANFPNGHFDVVLCNAVLEHDPFFWKTLSEIRRVTRTGGLVVIGTPGYGELPFENILRRICAKFSWLSGNVDGFALQHSTLTLGVHDFPGDYYRFSEQAYREVFFEGMKEVVVRSVLVPPRIIGSGIRA